MPKDIKKVFGKVLRHKDPGGGGGGGGGGSSGGGGGGGGGGGSVGGGGSGGGGGGAGLPASQQVVLPSQDERIMGQLPQVFDGDCTKVKAL